jgi:hypothetical protein
MNKEAVNPIKIALIGGRRSDRSQRVRLLADPTFDARGEKPASWRRSRQHG